MELRHLRYFVAVAEERHVTRTAERLGMQQPPLSQQIKALEAELKVQLFRRKPRGVELTAPGGALFDDARAILARVDHALSSTQRTARGEQGRIVVGLTFSTSYLPFVPCLIRSYREAHPLISVALEENSTIAILDALQNERIDAAFTRSPLVNLPFTDPAGLVLHTLVEEPMLVALPESHRLAPMAGDADPPPLLLKVLAAENFILYLQPVGPGLYDSIVAACRRAGFSPRIAQETPRILSTLNLVAAGLGISLVPASLSRVRLDGVVYRRLEQNTRLTAPLNLVHRRVGNSAATQRFIDLARRTARTYRADEIDGA